MGRPAWLRCIHTAPLTTAGQRTKLLSSPSACWYLPVQFPNELILGHPQCELIGNRSKFWSLLVRLDGLSDPTHFTRPVPWRPATRTRPMQSGSNGRPRSALCDRKYSPVKLGCEMGRIAANLRERSSLQQLSTPNCGRRLLTQLL